MRLIALAGNPNVGKSTLFNALTGLRQHTGNWPGKTVDLAQGSFDYKGQAYQLVDLPGTYSLSGQSPEEQVAEDVLCREPIECILAVCDATRLERSLLLVLQLLRLGRPVLLCVNLMDEAEREGIMLDLAGLERRLGIPVLGLSAERQEGIDTLRERLRSLCDGFLPCAPVQEAAEDPEVQTRADLKRAAELAAACVQQHGAAKPNLTTRLDRVFLHPVWGHGCLLLLLLGVFWLTIEGANYPSRGLQWCFDRLRELLQAGAEALALPPWLRSALLDGIYGTVARVVAVMLPPMLIFFPCFTLLEDLGYLPRVAFLMDEGFRRAGACGKQSLTLCMGFGCNAVGVTGCRIIDSPRERLIAILTNAFVPCNGRFPGILFLISFHFAGHSALLGAVLLTLCILLCVGMTLLASKFLHGTVLRGQPSAFVLEMPPYRRPRWGQVILRALRDRTLFILSRAVLIAAPAGLLIWLLGNITVEGTSLLLYVASWLDDPAALLGLSGAVLLAFFLGTPANELVLPILMMILTARGTITDTGSMATVLNEAGWTLQLSVCTLLFHLFHWPCATTLLTIHRETGSLKWTLWSALLPTAFGCILCALAALLL